MHLNNNFQFLNKITCIFTHFFTHTYFQKKKKKKKTTLLEQYYQTWLSNFYFFLLPRVGSVHNLHLSSKGHKIRTK